MRPVLTRAKGPASCRAGTGWGGTGRSTPGWGIWPISLLVIVPMTVPVILLADLPDDAGPGDLHDRRVVGGGHSVPNGTGRSGLPTVSRDPEVHQVERAVRPELAIHRTVD